MPFKYAQKEVQGIVYILSFGIGVAIVSFSSPPQSESKAIAVCGPAAICGTITPDMDSPSSNRLAARHCSAHVCVYASERHLPRLLHHVVLHADVAVNKDTRWLQVTCSAAVCFFGLLAACRRKLPSMQVRVASGPACLTGLLWSIGNFLSIYAVQVSPSQPHCHSQAFHRLRPSLA